MAKFQVMSQYLPRGIVDITNLSVRVAEIITWDLSNTKQAGVYCTWETYTKLI